MLLIKDINRYLRVKFKDINVSLLTYQMLRESISKMVNDIIKNVLNSSESTLLIVIYNNQNQRRYLGVKLK